MFDSDTMCDLHGGERPDWNGGIVQLAISPMITKYGDEQGSKVSCTPLFLGCQANFGQLSCANILCKARVYCYENQ